jgi:hypothetical protein
VMHEFGSSVRASVLFPVSDSTNYYKMVTTMNAGTRLVSYPRYCSFTNSLMEALRV